jgi:intracellular multiplication protein IcmT
MWRNTGQPVRLLMLDARACLPILCVMVYWSWPTLYIAISGVAFFSTISSLG